MGAMPVPSSQVFSNNTSLTPCHLSDQKARALAHHSFTSAESMLCNNTATSHIFQDCGVFSTLKLQSLPFLLKDQQEDLSATHCVRKKWTLNTKSTCCAATLHIRYEL